MSGRARAILAVARLTFRESSRNRALHAVIGAMLLITAAAHLFAWVSGDEAARRLKVIGDLSLTAISLLGILASISLGTTLVYQEVERRTIYTVLARPIGRGSFLVGKYLGLLGIVGVACLAMGAAFFASYLIGALCLPAPGVELASLPWLKLLLAVVFTYVELAVVIGIALFFSVAAHPVEGAVFSFSVVLFGHTTESLKDLAAQLWSNAGEAPSLGVRALVGFLDLIYVLLPNLEHFNLRSEAIHDLAIQWQHLALALVYAAAYALILLVLGSAVLRRKVL